jgi:hypothetical protein
LRWQGLRRLKMAWRPSIFKRPSCNFEALPYSSTMSAGNHPMNDNEQRPVTIITGRVRRRKGGKSEGVHIMLVAPDDDTAVRTALDSLTREGFAEAELDQIGDMEGVPDEEPHLSAYQGAVEGEVSIVTFDEAD